MVLGFKIQVRIRFRIKLGVKKVLYVSDCPHSYSKPSMCVCEDRKLEWMGKSWPLLRCWDKE